MNKYSQNIRKNLENNLPDYVFGKLDENEKIKFEAEIMNFPDLLKLAGTLKQNFSIVDKEKIENKIQYQTSNLPEEVLYRRKNRKRKSNIHLLSRSLFYTIPAAAVILIAYFILPDSFRNKGEINTSPKKTELFTINDNDLNSLNDYDALENALQGISDKSSPINTEEVDLINEISDSHYSSFFSDIKYSSLKKQLVPEFNDDKSINNYLEMINENDLETILQEIENVEI